MKNYKKLLSFLLILVMVLSLAACSSDNSEETTDTSNGDDFSITLKFAFANSATDPASIALKEMCDRVTERTEGHINMEFYPNNELGGIADVTEQIQQNATIITSCSADFLADYCPDHAALNGAYLYDSWEDMQIIADSDWYAGLKDQMDEKKIHVLFFGWNGGHRHMISNSPIKTPEDLVGKNARVSGGLMFVEMYKAFGASPVTLPWSEVYQGLQQDVVDLAEAPLFTMAASSLQEVSKYITLTSHIICADTLFMNTDVYNSIPEEYRTILEEEVSNTVLAYNATVDDNEAAALETMKEEGVTIIELTDEERAEFAEASKSMYSNIDSLSDGIYETIRGIIEAGK